MPRNGGGARVSGYAQNSGPEMRGDPSEISMNCYTKAVFKDWHGAEEGARLWELAAEKRVDANDGRSRTRWEFLGRHGTKQGVKLWESSLSQSGSANKGKQPQSSHNPNDSTIDVVLKLDVPQNKWGRLCGVGGARLRELEEKHNVRIRIPWRKSKSGGGHDAERPLTVDVIGSRAAAEAAWWDIERYAGGKTVLVEEVNVTEREAARDEDEAVAASELVEERCSLLQGLPTWEACECEARSLVWGDVVEIIAPSLDDDDSFGQKAAVAKDLQRMLRECDHPRARIFLFGSSITGLAERSADLDISCDLNGDGKSPPPDEAKLVESVMGKLKSRHQLKDLRCIPNARVPIVTHKPCNVDLARGIDGATFDLSFRLLGAVNSRLLRHYVTGNPALRIAAVAVKAWSKRVGITDSRNGYLTSYAVVIMLIYCRLRYDLAQWCAPLSIRLQDCESLPPPIGVIPEESSQLRTQVGEIIGKFWYFYACEFDWDKEVVSINESRAGGAWVGRLEKGAIGWDCPPAKDRQKELGRYNFTCIADPYELRSADEPGFNLGRHLSALKTAEVRLKFAKAWAAFLADDPEKASDEFISSLSLV